MGKVLVINNDFDIMDLLQKWLEKSKNFSVKYTADGEEALHFAKQFKPDVVLVDVLQKEAAKKIKSDKETEKIPIIFMTGYTINQLDGEIKFADDVIEKPFDPKELQKKIERLLKKTV